MADDTSLLPSSGAYQGHEAIVIALNSGEFMWNQPLVCKIWEEVSRTEVGKWLQRVAVSTSWHVLSHNKPVRIQS